MKKILLMSLLFVSLTAGCKKDKDPEADLATKASGTFNATRFILGETNIPLGGGTELSIVIQKATAETVTGVIRFRLQGVPQDDVNAGTLTVKDAGPSGVDLYESSTRVGNVSKDNQLTLSGNAEGQFYEIIASRQ
ncbi:MAG: hypothetical protein LRY55_06035 [Leadbetterella sp.]|nr:hypothetical protein [Leadbetterella sp.]